MRRYIFKLSDLNEAKYVSDYSDEIKLKQGEFVVTFNTSDFKDVIFIDDGDMRCLITQTEKKLLPSLSR